MVVEHFIITCLGCGAEWDSDYDPPLCVCDDLAPVQTLRVEERDE